MSNEKIDTLAWWNNLANNLPNPYLKKQVDKLDKKTSDVAYIIFTEGKNHGFINAIKLANKIIKVLEEENKNE